MFGIEEEWLDKCLREKEVLKVALEKRDTAYKLLLDLAQDYDTPAIEWMQKRTRALEAAKEAG